MLRAAARRVVPLPVRVALRQWPRMLALMRLPAAERGRAEDFPWVQCSRSTPLRRETAVYGEALQRAKEQNVALAARVLDGVVIGPRGFSWHRALGPPVAWRGFAAGPELHDDVLEPGAGGGLCQVANLVFWLALHAGLEVVERHRHALDLFPDESRSTPFGCGATVFFPHKDLKLRSQRPALLSLTVEGGALHGALRYAADPGFTCEVLERDARFVREGGHVFRENALWRRFAPSGREELVARHRARVTYPVA